MKAGKKTHNTEFNQAKNARPAEFFMCKRNDWKKLDVWGQQVQPIAVLEAVLVPKVKFAFDFNFAQTTSIAISDDLRRILFKGT